VAVDNLLEGLRSHGVKALRFGSAERVKEELQQYTLDRLLEEHPLMKEIENLAERAGALRYEIDALKMEKKGETGRPLLHDEVESTDEVREGAEEGGGAHGQAESAERAVVGTQAEDEARGVI
jgi:hypothetical protein